MQFKFLACSRGLGGYASARCEIKIALLINGGQALSLQKMSWSLFNRIILVDKASFAWYSY